MNISFGHVKFDSLGDDVLLNGNIEGVFELEVSLVELSVESHQRFFSVVTTESESQIMHSLGSLELILFTLWAVAL